MIPRGKTMLIHSKMDSSSVNGPGNRAVLWFQGCSLACKGCWNPETHAFHERNRISIGDIQDWITNLKDVEGITLSGGEPMQQAPYLYVLVAWIREHRPDLTIGMYTGYNLKELENGTFKWKSAEDADWQRGSKQLWAAIKEHLDFAVTGRYIESVACHDEPLRGSRNQEVVFFTDRYKESDLSQQMAEISVDMDALIQITGYPTVEFLEEVTRKEIPNIPMSRTPVACTSDDNDGDLVGA
jgi:anaerobic ribonucleoside-triphosphate reductase activating protein